MYLYITKFKTLLVTRPNAKWGIGENKLEGLSHEE